MTQGSLGAYELQEEIGRGGMGVVYRALQPALGRLVAVKVLLPHIAQDPEFLERFLREARSAAKLEHPGIVTIYDVGEHEGTYFFSMQYLEGLTLDAIIRNKDRLPFEQATSLAAQVGDALGYAHQAGIVHRDVKPANVIVDRNGRAVLTDFGIAWAASETRLTRTGSSIGSPEFMSPEQIMGEPIDHRSDLYALGIVYYQMLTGVLPYSGDTALAVAYKHVNDPVRSALDLVPGIPSEVDDVVCRLMAKKPTDRYETAAEFLADLRAKGIETLTPAPAFEPTAQPTQPGDGDAGSQSQVEDPSADEKQPLGSRKSMWLAGLGISLLGLLMVVALFAFLQGRGGAPGSSEGGVATSSGAAGQGEPGQAGEQESTGEDGSSVGAPFEEGSSASSALGQRSATTAVSVVSDPSGAEIWIDGEDSGKVTPADLQLSGVSGSEIHLELRRDGEILASELVVVGPDMENEWAPELPAALESYTVSSRPEGATITLNGETTAQQTPALLELEPGRQHQIVLQLEGYDPASWTFTLEDLSGTQKESRTLHFPLQSSIPPGSLRVQGSYPVGLRVAGRTYASAAEHRLSLAPGEYSVELTAPEVFLRQSETVRILTEEQTLIRLPAVVTVPVRAFPSNCRVRIDGREAGFVPLELELTVGSHEFEFLWDSLGEGQVRMERIGPRTEQVFARAPGK